MSSRAVIAAVEDGHIANWGEADRLHHITKGKKEGTPVEKFASCIKDGQPWPCEAILRARALPQEPVREEPTPAFALSPLYRS